MSLLNIQTEFKEEYDNLGTEEREAMVQEFKDVQQTVKNIRRPSPRARIQEVSNTVRNIVLLVSFHRQFQCNDNRVGYYTDRWPQKQGRRRGILLHRSQQC